MSVYRDHEKMTDSKWFSMLDALVEFGSCPQPSGDLHLCVFSFTYVSAPASSESHLDFM